MPIQETQEMWVRCLGQEDLLEEGPTPVLLPGEFRGQKSQAGYGPWVTKSQT